MRIDHVVYAVADLDAAGARMEREHGLRVAGGGRHEGIGTENRVLPLGGGFLELVTVADREEAERGSPFGRALLRRLDAGEEGFAGWAVAVEDVALMARRLGAPIMEIGRSGMTARLTGVDAAMARPCLPFFIERDPGVADPGASGDSGGLRWVEVAGDPAELADWLGGAELPVRVRASPPAAPALLAVGVGDALVLR